MIIYNVTTNIHESSRSMDDLDATQTHSEVLATGKLNSPPG
jgi:hypothetical protein